jgi:hypothetical protein
MLQVNDDKRKLSNLQLELLKSLKYTATEKQLQDVKSLLRLYFTQQLDVAIEKTETEKNYSATIYEEWLKKDAASNTNK